MDLIKLHERIDIIMCTYNSDKPYFHVVLQRIFQEIPVHCFIAVDRYSSDGTVNKILKIFPKAKVILSKENLGKAREIGINVADTPLFAFIDDDVLLLKGWYEYTRGLMDNRMGAVACYANDKTHLTRGLYKFATRPRLVVSSKKNVDSQRGFTYATLIRKVAVASWKPDRTLVACEDHEFLRHVVKRGFLWLTSYFAFAEHLQPDQNYFTFFRNIWRKTAWNTAGCRNTGLIKLNPVQLIFRSLLKFWSGIKESISSRNALVLTYHSIDALAFFYSYICWRKHLFLRR